VKVLHVDAGREWRGGQTQLLALVTRIGGPVVVHPEAPLRPALERAGVETLTAPFRGRWWGAAELRAIVRRLRPELVAAHDGHGAALALRCGARVVVHRRVDFAPSWLGARRYRRAAGVVAVSGAVARVMRRAGVERVAVVHDGVDPGPIERAPVDRAGIRAELGLDPTATLVCAVGALVDHKAHHLLVRAMAQLPGAHLVVLGEGPLRARLRDLAGELGVRLHLIGHRADVGRWLRSCDAFAHPSVEEGLGQAVIEAAFAGIPSVVSTAGGLGELGLGIPVEPGDVDGLARGLRQALGGVAAPDRTALVERFGVERMVADTIAAYRRWAL
jgi:glycosyltransferase involved in cell wall biosynthesis